MGVRGATRPPVRALPVRTGTMIEERVGELKAIIADHDGRNAADRRFARAVDDLLSAFYDDIGRISTLKSRALFDLLVIKVLYVGRRSCHADVVDYLGELLERYIDTRELYPPDAEGRPTRMYFSDVTAGDQPDDGASRFDAYRRYADSALFLSGVFPPSPRRRKPARSARASHTAPVPSIDGAYYVSTGKAMYRMAAGEREAGAKSQPETLTRLAEFFEVYASALAEMSERYILGADRALIADKMLDAFNAYRRSGDAQRLDSMRRYAEILHVDPRRFPSAG